MQATDGPARIVAVEMAALNAWPAREVKELGGWRLRNTDGVTRRANSVWPNRCDGMLDTGSKVDAVEKFYADRALPARFQICPVVQPSNLDQLLSQRGYRAVSRTGVQVLGLAGIDLPAATHAAGVTVLTGPTPEWLRCYATAEGFSPKEAAARRAILSRLDGPAGFALSEVNGEVVAVGLGSIYGDWLGISCMSTLPAFRRRGIASALLAALLTWALDNGADHAYLQVMDENGPARSLYAGLGFETLYHYHYRERTVAR